MSAYTVLEHKDNVNYVKSVVLLSHILVVQVHMVKKRVVTFEETAFFVRDSAKGHAFFI